MILTELKGFRLLFLWMMCLLLVSSKHIQAEPAAFRAIMFQSSPWVSKDSNGVYTGIMPEFYALMSKKTGFRFHTKTGNLKRAYADFRTNQSDLTICFIVHKPQGAIVIGEFGELEQGFIARKGALLDSMEDLRHKKVGILRGTYTGIPESISYTAVPTDTNEAGIKMLMAGRIDYLYFFGGMYRAAKNAGFSEHDFGPKLIVGKESYGFFLNHTSELATSANIDTLRKAFLEIKDSGEFDRLVSKWF